ncbi:molybdenum cofactor cytidylyltransferase [Tenacibaculum sp. 190524A02b]|uniref:Molybdenum cofactor cytidylyltransferase n=1 Tax=Tenacibaculum vairaonense TaxID=3137860 RepID=A0ABP1FDM1_9FLAO
MKVAILILAAGTSSRMGRIKQVLPYKHTTLLGWTIEQVIAVKEADTFVVLGANMGLIKKSIDAYSITIIENKSYREGLSTSIVTGINTIEVNAFDKVLILLADQPKITTDYLKKLIEISKKNQAKIIASNYGDKIGVPAIFPKKYFSKLKELTGDKGAGKLLNTTLKSEVLSLLNSNLTDIDTLTNYHELLKG